MKSIGKILQAKRIKKNFTIDDIHKHIKIHPSYIRALENDDYSVFDGKVHSKGFLKIYAQFLELDLDEILALWRREYEQSFESQDKNSQNRINYIEKEKFVFTSNMVFTTFFIVLIMGFFGFLYFQYRNYTDAPKIDVYYPQENQVMNNDLLDITGKVELDSEVYINNQKILFNTDGSFLTSIKLREGINTISIKAINKLDKETEIIRTVIYRPQQEEIIMPEIIDSTEPTIESIIESEEMEE